MSWALMVLGLNPRKLAPGFNFQRETVSVSRCHQRSRNQFISCMFVDPYAILKPLSMYNIAREKWTNDEWNLNNYEHVSIPNTFVPTVCVVSAAELEIWRMENGEWRMENGEHINY
jgi:hypothetical protein